MSEHDSTCAQRQTPQLNAHHLDRFRSKYLASDDGCWEWQGRLNQHGYGVFVIGHSSAFLAHRVAYEHFIGPIPAASNVCHKCDNRRCVNPEHLFAGTQADNVRDMMKKGRHVVVPRSGERNPAAILTDEQVADIRRRYIPRVVTLAHLASEYGVSQSAISMIVNRKRRA